VALDWALDAARVRRRVAIHARAARLGNDRIAAAGPGRRLRACRRWLGRSRDYPLPAGGDTLPTLPLVRIGGLGGWRDGRARTGAGGLRSLRDGDLSPHDW